MCVCVTVYILRVKVRMVLSNLRNSQTLCLRLTNIELYMKGGD